jgi:hypothetical protein
MPNIDIKKIFSLKYWLEGSTAGADTNISTVEINSFFYYFYISIFSGFLIIAIVLIVYKIFLAPNSPLQPKLSILSQNFVWMGILGILWFLARQTGVSFLGSRMWLIFGFIWVASLLLWFIRYLMLFYPLEISFFKKQQSKK